MSSTAQAAVTVREEGSGMWARWLRQVGAILRLESRKNFLGKRALLIYLLAVLPVLLLLAMALFGPTARRLAEPGFGQVIFAYIYEGLILRAVVFFGCAWIFMNLFRGEIVDRSLHYYLLSAVRREVLIAGKFLSGLLASSVLFGGAALACLLISYAPRGASATAQHFTNGPGFGHVFGYVGVTVLACVGYGAVFLAIGLVFRNPIFPALVIYGWEWINFLLPPILKKFSVIHYLQSLLPVSVPEGPFAILADPTPVWVAVPGFIITTTAVLAFAAWRIKTLEIRYGSE